MTADKRIKKRGKKKKKSGLFHYLLLMELTLIFSFAVSFLMLTMTGEIGGSSRDNPYLVAPDYQNLFSNYDVLNKFLHLEARTLEPPGIDLETGNPLVDDFVKLKAARSYLEEKNYTALDAVLQALDTPGRHPLVIKQAGALALEYLFAQRKYEEFIAAWNQRLSQPPTGRKFRLFLAECYRKTGDDDQAFALFKEIFAHTNLQPFEEVLPQRTLNRYLRRLDYDYWFEKFKFLARNNRFTEFQKERRYYRDRQLNGLFDVEFDYRQKQYDRCRKPLEKITDQRLATYKERILLKLDLREDNTENLFQQLEALKRDPGVYREVLLDAAGILMLSGNPKLCLELYNRYIDYVETFQLLRSYVLRFNYSMPRAGKSRPIRDANYWKSVWLCAWLSYQTNDKKNAAAYFKKGIQAPIHSYSIASNYWFLRVNRSISIDMGAYPFSYYYTREEKITPLSLRSFIDLMNDEQSPRFKKITGQVYASMRHNLPDEAAGLIRWSLENEKKTLSVSDKHTLMLIESIIYLKKGNDAMAFIRFRDNFDCYRCVRLPRFLSRIALPVKYVDLIEKYCSENKIERELVFALIREESFFRADAVSPADAHGLMQLLLKTAREMAYRYNVKVFTQDLYDPGTNIRFGVEYLKYLLDKYNDKWHLALAAYNAGDERVDEWKKRFGAFTDDEFIEMIPFSETRGYVKNILRNYYYYKFYYGNGN
jgi:soluble lytic murein transglycosylase-like protein